MTKKERANPLILQASRKKRIAKGAGLEVSELNKLIKMHRQMADMMKKMGKTGGLKQMMATMFGKNADLNALSQASMTDKADNKALNDLPNSDALKGLDLSSSLLSGNQNKAPDPLSMLGLPGFGKKR